MYKNEFYFVRHGQTGRNVKATLPDITIDDPLNDTGILQVKETASKITEIFGVVVSSPYARTVETRDIIVKEWGYLPIIETDNRLVEVNFGALKQKTWDKVEQSHPENNFKESYLNQEYDFSKVDGESFVGVRKRVYECLNELKAKYPQERILIVTHAGIIRMLYKTELNQTFAGLDNASVHKFLI